jgi:alkylhydroperoxidase family enzyme
VPLDAPPEITGRYAALTQRVVESIVATPGHTTGELRRAVLARAASPGTTNDGLPGPLGAYVDKVARHAYRVTDDDVAALQRGGNTDDALFEVTVAAAVGAALARLERGLATLRQEGSR